MSDIEWKKAACKGQDTRDFFEGFDKGNRGKRLEILAFCNVCPIKDDCYDYARKEGLCGIWGGTSFNYGKPVVHPLRVKSVGKWHLDPLESLQSA